MLDQGAFHVERADPVAGGGDDVVVAAHEADGAILVAFHGVAAEIVIAEEGFARRGRITVEPEQRRLASVHRQNPRFPGGQLLALVVHHHHPMAGHRHAGGAFADRVTQRVVVAQHHAQLGLAVVVVDGDAQFLGEPADHRRGERFAGTADGAQATAQRFHHRRAAGHHQAEGGGRAGQVGDAVFLDHPAGAFNGEAPGVEGGGMAQGQRAGDGVVQAIGPARIGQVPEPVVLAQAHRVAQVALEGEDRLERHRHRLGQAGGAGGEHHQKRRLGIEHHRRMMVPAGFQQGMEVAVVGAVGVHRDHRRPGFHLVEFFPIGPVGDDQAGVRGLHPVLDGLGSEGGEQRLVDRPQPPGGEHRDQQFHPPGQQAGHPVAGAHAPFRQHGGEAPGGVAQLLEGELLALAVLAFLIQRHPVVAQVAVAAFHAGVQGIQGAVQVAPGGLAQIELAGGGVVVTHGHAP